MSNGLTKCHWSSVDILRSNVVVTPRLLRGWSCGSYMAEAVAPTWPKPWLPRGRSRGSYVAKAVALTWPKPWLLHGRSRGSYVAEAVAPTWPKPWLPRGRSHGSYVAEAVAPTWPKPWLPRGRSHGYYVAEAVAPTWPKPRLLRGQSRGSYVAEAAAPTWPKPWLPRGRSRGSHVAEAVAPKWPKPCLSPVLTADRLRALCVRFWWLTSLVIVVAESCFAAVSAPKCFVGRWHAFPAHKHACARATSCTIAGTDRYRHRIFACVWRMSAVNLNPVSRLTRSCLIYADSWWEQRFHGNPFFFHPPANLRAVPLIFFSSVFSNGMSSNAMYPRASTTRPSTISLGPIRFDAAGLRVAFCRFSKLTTVFHLIKTKNKSKKITKCWPHLNSMSILIVLLNVVGLLSYLANFNFKLCFLANL